MSGAVKSGDGARDADFQSAVSTKRQLHLQRSALQHLTSEIWIARLQPEVDILESDGESVGSV